MYRLPAPIQFLVELAAIKSRRDLIVKPVVYTVALVIFSVTLEQLLTPPDQRKPIVFLAGLVTALSAPFTIFFFAIISYLYKLQAELWKLALTDALTGLPNRAAFLADATHMLKTAPQYVLLILDADHFKRINDTYGHAAGDAALRVIASAITDATGPSDCIGRLGGEEFGVLLHADDDRLNKVSRQLIGPFDVPLHDLDMDQTIQVSLSIGAVFAVGSRTIERQMQKADEALYRAKSQGRARLCIWQNTRPHAA